MTKEVDQPSEPEIHSGALGLLESAQNAVNRAMSFIGMVEHPKKWRADDLREAEAEDVAIAIREAIGDGWSVHDETTAEWRPARALIASLAGPERPAAGAGEGVAVDVDEP